jgi:ABC-2 type transport system permease protein
MIFFNSRRFAGYPISIYPWVIQKLLIFVIPFGFVSYFPAQFFLQKPEIGNYWSGYMYMPLLVGIIMYALVYAFWKVGLKNYSSTGNSMY